MFTDDFVMLAASVQGQRHLATGVNNQDAVWTGTSENAFVGIVCDGCSSSYYAEVGARLHAEILGPAVLNAVDSVYGMGGKISINGLLTPDLFLNGDPKHERLPSPRKFLHDQLYQFMGLMSASTPLSRKEVLSEYLFATVMGVVVSEDLTFIFRRGDGLWQLNGGPPVVLDENDTPSYFVYGLLPNAAPQRFDLEAVLPTSEVSRVLIGSDGMERFIRYADHPSHGDKPLGPLEQFYDPVYLTTPSNAQARLMAVGPYRGWRRGSTPLDDDTSFVSIQRKPKAG